MTGLLVAVVCFGWLTVSMIFARRTYRREYAARLGRQSAAYGKTTPEVARKKALDSAYEEIYKWPTTLAFRIFDWVITTEHLFGVPDSLTDPWLWQEPKQFTVIDARPERDGTDELIDRLDRELNGVRVTHQEPGAVIEVCPCGYRTECPIHCGSGHDTGRCPHWGKVWTGARWVDRTPENVRLYQR